MKSALKSRKIAYFAVSVLLITVVAAAAVFGAGAFSAYKSSTFDRSQYRAQLADIYVNYNTDKAFSDYDSGEKFAFSRLLVYGAEGRDYGAVQSAYDAENDFSVLQYSTPADAKKAYYKIMSDGLTVDAEGTAELCSDTKGDLYPEGSNVLGTPQYLGKYAMGSDDVVLALIDTGVMYNHEALADRFVNNGYDFTGDGCADAYYDTGKEGAYYWHSTFIAGIVADNTPDSVKILPYKVVPFGASTAVASAVINAINDAVSSGATVINVSLSSESNSTLFRNAVKNAFNNGVCLCASAGNLGKEVSYYYPSCIDESITVSALDTDFDSITTFSNYGRYIDFCAPGENIVSLAPYSKSTDKRTKTGSGTSFSAPYIATLCANLKTVNSSMSVDEVCGVLKDFAVDLGDEGRDNYYGWGMPVISDVTYTDGESYTYKIPEGTLSVYGTKNYTADTQPWRIFADRLVSVNIADGVERIGEYNFYNVKSATFTMAENYDKIGKYAFYGCESVKHMTFTENCDEIGTGAFGAIEGFTMSGFRNTAAEAYALNENIPFSVLGCRHNYLVDIFDPTDESEGYTLYTCSVCGDVQRGEYIVPEVLDGGQCGDNLYYEYYSIGKLKISGSGDMYSYAESSAPWAEYARSINTLEISDDCTVSALAFYNCNSIVKIKCSQSNVNYTVSDNVLYSKDMKTLVLLPYLNGREYVMPDCVRTVQAPALICSAVNAVTFNSNFTVDDSVVYDACGNIALALPSYKNETLNITDDISISDYAFILTDYPSAVNADSPAASYGSYCIGYAYNGGLTKRDVSFITLDSGTAKQYAEENGFNLVTYNRGACGENVSWYYDTAAKKLTVSGEGDMYRYSSESQIPWSAYLSEINEVFIGDGITSLSDYSFYGATSLKTLTMPLSLSAPKNATVWYSCKSIKTVVLKQGSGIMDDYADDSVTFYQYTPWYLSRKSITSFSLSESVLYIGKQAFRACTPLKTLTLTQCEAIAEDAFLACTKLNEITLKSRTCEIADWALFSYKISSYGIYGGTVLYGYDDSTARDYCDKFGVTFESLGCCHSRNTELISGEIHTCCFDSVYNFHCNDCGSDFTEYVHTTDGHYVKGTLCNLDGRAIAGAEVYIDDEPVAVTSGDGTFIAEKIKCGNHTVVFKKNSQEFMSALLTVSQSNTTGDFTASYGDYNSDGIVNGRDLAFAKLNGIDDYKLFDWGAGACDVCADTPYGEQSLPNIEVLGFSDAAGSDFKKAFTVKLVNDSEYVITAMGFMYGKELDENDLVIEKADACAENGNTIRMLQTNDMSLKNKALTYGLKNKDSWFGVRAFIIYSNGVSEHIYYTDVYTYSYV